MIEIVHTVFGFYSLIFGTYVVLQTKGTRQHVWIGRCYAISMLVLCLTAFGIYELYGGFGIFHVAAIVSLLSTLGGVIAVYLKRKLKAWRVWHYQFMAWSYVGLLAATSNEIFVHIGFFNELAVSFQYSPLISLALIMGGGGFYINSAMKRILEGSRHRAQVS